jgi:hypothetical protein
MTAAAPHPVLLGLRDINWEDTGSVLTHATPIFDALCGKPDLLTGLLDNLSADEHLAPMCEHYDFMDKLVLHDDTEAQARVRLHLYRPGYFDRPHNHRWSFASHILRGSYLHRIFGRDDQFGEDTEPDTLQPIHERVEGPGATYALHHTSVHTVQAEADTISILLRGPAAKDRFLILDRAGPSFWVYGAAQESPQTRASKQMAPERLDETIVRVRLLTAPVAGPAPAEV